MITNAKKCGMRPLFPAAATSSTVIDRPAALYEIPRGLKNPPHNSTMDMFIVHVNWFLMSVESCAHLIIFALFVWPLSVALTLSSNYLCRCLIESISN